ncbi:hypothetical protein B0J11DRAFT_214640 [Dendryphion nanum]|uniref:Uncharacterized protein n=1 Tax=Dendryphion nanum TaxID=256645 RepID=A0A9P9IV84_9PLEO|nr:hypothetical protein B0J11DRAFT_214640 [Dendryphion nanum]
MAQFQYNSYQYPEQPQVLLATDHFDYGQYEDSRSKTPTSLINHTGHSPGPLSTPPMSRNPSQLPHQAPDFMICDGSINSPSDSPTSVSTPDNESFEEVEMLDSDPMRDHYSHRHSNTMMNSHMSQGPMLALQTGDMITDQALQQALNDTLAAQQFQDLGTPFHAAASQSMIPNQQYNQNYSQTYTNQHYRNDPWTSQRASFNAVPRSGIAVFDPASDPAFLSSFTANRNVNFWTDNNTDPNYLISPNEPAQQPQEPFFSFSAQDISTQDTFQHQLQHQHQHQHSHYHDHSPVDMNMTAPSPNPDSQNFVNYNQSSAIFTENYVTGHQFPTLSTDTSMIAQGSYPSSIGNLSRSSSNMGQPAHSPYNNVAPSPGGSEGMFPLYPRSESGMHNESFPPEQFNLRSVPPPSPDTNPTSDNPSPEHEQEPPRRARSSATNKGAAGRPGGRALGTHLEPTVAKAAHDMRKIVACWHCVLQRDKCGPGDTCERCVKRAQRPNADCGLGCIRVKLAELTEFFLPTLVTQMHEDAQLTHFVSQHIRQWGNVEITIPMTCGQKNMPRITVKVYEFLPNGNELLEQIQYKTDPITHKRIAMTKKSPALGMVHINHNEEKRYDKYITEIVEHHIDAFGNLCWMEDDNDFQKKLFRLISRVQMKSEEESKLLREVLRLIVCTFIMSHTLTIAEEHKHTALSKMHSYQGPQSYVENFTSPRMTNRQLKYFFCRLHRTIMSNVLNKLQQIFKSSKGCDKWMAAFVVVVGMSMAHEDQQKTIHLIMETKARTEGWDHRDAQGRADIACRDIDKQMGLITNIFRWKYNRKCNPLRDADHDWEREAGFGDASSVSFVRSVAQLIKENIDFLRERQSISISSFNQEKYTSRLVAQFLLSFWLPQI